MLSEKDRNVIREIAGIISDELLDIDTPEIKFERCDEWPTDTTKAMAVVGDGQPVVYVDPSISLNPETVLYIGHELRHVYQYYVLGLKQEFIAYMTSDRCNTEEYNLQPLEIDANAFGSICMVEFAHSRPLWNGLSEKVKQRIYAQEEQIIHNEFY